ncbi:hypothetical protein [Atlantibacter hermannii]|uniref:hypothetical protein n=1 Tax=Atlantibacter hermannii TaxID=565 RepID=UPI0028977A6E|nr:hypothetical protein [Atlantibacter hermannii]
MKTFILIFIFIASNVFASEPEYIVQGRKWLARWGEVYCIRTYSLQKTIVQDVDDSFHLFDYSEVVNSLIFDDKPRGVIFSYIDKNIDSYGNVIDGKHFNLLACIELIDSDEFKSLIKKQDGFLYQSNAGVGAVIRAVGQKSPFSGTWRMISKYDTYSVHFFNKGDVFPKWKSSEGIEGNEWVLDSRSDGGSVKLESPYF